ncbi:MAG: adenylate/guanylate cyclase domain-containing protein [Cyanobacteriota bacterium]
MIKLSAGLIIAALISIICYMFLEYKWMLYLGIIFILSEMLLFIFLLIKSSKSDSEIFLKRIINPDLQPVKKQISLLSCSIQNFSSFQNNISLEENRQFLEEYYSLINKIINRNGGVLENQLKDTVLICFGAIYSDNKHPENAIRTALKIKEVFEGLKVAWKSKTTSELQINLGVITDIAVVGVVGTKYYPGYISIGNSVDLAIALDRLNRKYNSNIIINKETLEKVSGLVSYEELPLFKMKNIDKPIEVYMVHEIKE